MNAGTPELGAMFRHLRN